MKCVPLYDTVAGVICVIEAPNRIISLLSIAVFGSAMVVAAMAGVFLDRNRITLLLFLWKQSILSESLI